MKQKLIEAIEELKSKYIKSQIEDDYSEENKLLQLVYNGHLVNEHPLFTELDKEFSKLAHNQKNLMGYALLGNLINSPDKPLEVGKEVSDILDEENVLPILNTTAIVLRWRLCALMRIRAAFTDVYIRDILIRVY